MRQDNYKNEKYSGKNLYVTYVNSELILAFNNTFFFINTVFAKTFG